MKTISLMGITLLLGACGAEPPAIPTAHLLTYGQSLSLGARAVNGYPTDDTIPGGDAPVGQMFAGGTRPDDLSALVPFQESASMPDAAAWLIDSPGETPLYGALTQLQGIEAHWIGSAAGQGATSITRLGPGTVPYQRLLDQVTAGKALSPGGYWVPAIIWMQGESDVGNADYATEWGELVTNIDYDVRQITGQAQTVQIFTCLPWPRDIAAAQRQVAAETANVHIVCDTVDYAHSDGIHLTAASSRQVGVAMGQAINEYLTQH